jgi:hypothetical protein
VPSGEVLAVSPAVEHLPPRPPAPSEGVRVVTRDNGRYFDLMPSQLSWYLLPSLADCSLLRREARSAAGLLRFTGGSVELEEIGNTAVLDTWRTLFEDAGLLVGIRAISQYAQDLFDRLGSRSGGGGLLAPPTASPATIASLGVEAVISRTTEELPVIAPPAASTGTVTEPVAPDAPVCEVASRIAALSDLGDQRLADLFKVERETFCRWRTGVLTNPRVGNRRRLGLLLSLLEELAGRQVNIKDWLLNSVTPEGLTPYELLEQGRIDDAAFLAASIGEGVPVDRDSRVAAREEPEPLEFDDDDAWDYEYEDDEQ